MLHTTVQAELTATYQLATAAWSCSASRAHPQQACCLLYSTVLIVNKPFKALSLSPPAFTSNHALLHALKCVGKQDRYKSSKGCGCPAADIFSKNTKPNCKPHSKYSQHFVSHTFDITVIYIRQQGTTEQESTSGQRIIPFSF